MGKLGNNPLDGILISNQNINKIVEEHESLFSYDLIEEQDIRDDLIKYEKDVEIFKRKFVNNIIDLGEVLFKAQNRLANHKNGIFMKWYESLNMSSDFVSFCIKRYNFYLLAPEKKELISSLPVTVIKEVTKKGTSEEMVNKVLSGEIKTNKDLKKYVNENISSNNSKIYSKNENNSIQTDETIIEHFPEYITTGNNASDIITAEGEMQKELKIMNYLNSVRYDNDVSTSEIYNALYDMFKDKK